MAKLSDINAGILLEYEEKFAICKYMYNNPDKCNIVFNDDTNMNNIIVDVDLFSKFRTEDFCVTDWYDENTEDFQYCLVYKNANTMKSIKQKSRIIKNKFNLLFDELNIPSREIRIFSSL
jgi:hypothetical protein